MFDFWKRALDIVLSSVLIVLLSPVSILCWLLVKMDTPGPGFYTQRRIGKQGRIFSLFKIRSMKVGSEPGGYQTCTSDPRVTRVGRILRIASIDELPQLLNIVFGDMSFVGPRPDVPQQRSLYTDGEFAMRQSVRPGLTGLAQSRRRSSCSARHRKRYDLFYVNKRSCILDLKILVWTFRTVLRGLA